MTNSGPSYYCPYKGCTKEYTSPYLIYKHSREIHNSELATPTKSTFFKSSSGKVINFKINDRNSLDPGEKILLVQKNDQTYYCPYKGCTKECGSRRTIYNHSRAVHNSELPTSNMSPRPQLFMSSSGKVIDFKSK
ncbi:hypothetical protein BDA99DRAFT_109238 [Phascolomyces articulosus]|uniref:C2H2-type domain-containing protein n=1 Tax=Phascolomyces articulosus TaxID=60185 RepID=A0AAD5JWF1_9FUNG|nr:hypothetical protein BDA99DRAFT_109238 [Phascolomyces articulosus]